MATALSRRGMIVTLVVSLAASALAGTPALAGPYQRLDRQQERVVRGEVVKPQNTQQNQTRTSFKGAAVVWPKAKVTEVDPGAVRTNRTPEPPGPVRIMPAGEPGKKLRVETFDRDKTTSAGVNGLLFRVSGRDAKVSVDYTSFRSAYGGDWAARLKLTELPECALSTPDKPECAGKAMPSTNDVTKGTVTADQPTSSDATLMGLTSGTSISAGSYAATSLSPSATWNAGSNTGGFSWSYDMRTPPGLNGPAPKLALSYASASVDGMMAASNNQPSWVGEGFQFGANFIERRYKACADDMENNPSNKVKAQDQCWATDNAVLAMDGHAGELIKDATVKDRWHLRHDDGTYVERRTGGVDNGTREGEHWVVTTTDGTQYWFGRSKQSTLTLPVAGNHPGEQCAAPLFKDSFCTQAYRWNLEYVVDLHGNTMTYTYEEETNKYGRNNTDTDVAEYDRASHLKQIDYGTRVGRTETAPMQVVFETADRCASDCQIHDEDHWTDTPWDQSCTDGPCRFNAPTFWSTKRLASVTTKVGGSPVEKWTFGHSYPDPGDGTRAGLWLDKISREGLVGQSTKVPDITFIGEQLSNRVDTHSDQRAAMKWRRVKEINTETGGKITVTYSRPDCVANTRVPDENALQDNALRCYPVRWTAEGDKDPTLDFFHKYVVTKVTETDLTGGGPQMVTNYDYVGAPAWHYTDDDGFIKKEDKTWSVWRGYEKVRTTKGEPGEQTSTETRYFRGMHGDKMPSGTRSVVLPAIGVGSVPEANDEDSFAGMVREEIVYNGPGGAEVSATVTTPWQSAPTASRTINDVTIHARRAEVAGQHKRVALDGGRKPYATSSFTRFDDTYGMTEWVEDRGDDGVAGDETCVITSYARNTTTWLVDAVSRTQSFATDCAKASTSPSDADATGDTLTYFDGQEHGVAPTKGDVTTTKTLKSFDRGRPVYVTQAASAFDAYGRATTMTDQKGTTTTVYTPSEGGPVTKTVTTNALNWTTTTELQPAWNAPVSVVDPNQKRTDVSYDGLGRTTAVWLTGRADNKLADKKFEYLVRNNGVVAVTTKTKNPDGGYVTQHQLLDGLLRPRQTQGSEATGGTKAVVTDQYYDSAGREVRKNNPYVADTAPGTRLFKPTDDIPSLTETAFDGAGRIIEQLLKRDAPVTSPGGEVVHRTTTAYSGDRVDVTPPTGGTTISTVLDSKGRTAELRQYHAGVGVGSTDPATFDVTKYTYDHQDRLDTVTAPAGHVWDYDHDLRGRLIRTVDPDKGTTTLTYDDADQLESSKDDRDVTLAFTYDPLGRKTSVREGSKTGSKRSEWVYDKLANGTTTNGVLVKSIRHDGANQYIAENIAFDVRYNPTTTKFTVPPSETGLAGSYTYENSYLDNGAVDIMRIPALGNLKRERLDFDYDGLGLAKSVGTVYGTSGVDTLVTGTEYTSFGELAVYTLAHDENKTVDVARYYEETTRRLSRIWTQREKSPTDVSKVDYNYDAAGNVTKIADSVSGDTQCFRQDYLRRLKDAWTPLSGDCAEDPVAAAPGGPAKYWQSYGYNLAGDRTSLIERYTAPANRSVTYSPFAGKHSLASTLTTDGDGTRAGEYSYDDVGNMLTRPAPSGGSQTMTWDPEGKLATSTDSTGATSFVYDADGNRMIRRDPGGKTLYLPGQELRVTSAGARSATRYYSYAGQAVAVRSAAGLEWMSSDRNGTAEFTISNESQEVRTRRMMPFGEQRGDKTSWLAFLDKGFVGGTQDNTGLTHLGAREYEPSTGRFISVDPIMDLTDAQQMHGYSYSNNSPVTFSDPSGLSHSCPDNDCRNKGPSGIRAPEPEPILGGDAPAGSVTPAKVNKSSQDCSKFGYHVTDACEGAKHYKQPRPMTTIEKWHWGLDGFGFIPGFGEPADLTNCALYGYEGNTTDAVLSCAAVVPIAGWIPALVKAARKGGKHIDEGAEALAKCARPNSFSGDTLVLMVDGTTKRIDQIRVGDKVANSNPESAETGQNAVLEVYVTDADKDYVDLAVETPEGAGTVTATAHHKFYNATEHAWVDAESLNPGEELATPRDGRAIVFDVHSYAASLRTYNLNVAVVNTYYVLVGTTPVLVHNEGDDDLVRVGRWMGQAEYDKMVQTGMVQPGGGGMSYVVHPADPEAYRSARPGSVYAEFDVPRSSLIRGGRPGDYKIAGPDTIWSRLAVKRGGSPLELPPARNIAKGAC